MQEPCAILHDFLRKSWLYLYKLWMNEFQIRNSHLYILRILDLEQSLDICTCLWNHVHMWCHLQFHFRYKYILEERNQNLLFFFLWLKSQFYFWIYIQGVPPICWQLRTQFSISYNHLCQKVRPVLKFLWKKLSDGTLKPRKIKLEVFLNWISKNCVKFKKKIAPCPKWPIFVVKWLFYQLQIQAKISEFRL